MREAAAGAGDGERGGSGGRSADGGDRECRSSTTADRGRRESRGGAGRQTTRTECHSSRKCVQGPHRHSVGGGTPRGHRLRRRSSSNREIRGGGRNHQASRG